MILVRISIIFLLSSCSASGIITKEINGLIKSPPGLKKTIRIDSLVAKLNPLSSREREKIIVPLILVGNIPDFNLRLIKMPINYEDSNGKKYKAILFVSPDYLCIGDELHFMRVPLTPQAAQLVADSLHCVLPTKKIVDYIYKNAGIRIEPIPLTEKRDSIQTFLQHNNMIQNQLKFTYSNKIVVGLKKDVVQTPQIYSTAKTNRVAIYGWHQLNGKAIQPLYTGHVDWYVDYSHGIRLVYEKMIVNGKILFVKDVLNNPVLSAIICDEEQCRYTRYNE